MGESGKSGNLENLETRKAQWQNSGNWNLESGKGKEVVVYPESAPH
jgi:hypothetical protein